MKKTIVWIGIVAMVVALGAQAKTGEKLTAFVGGNVVNPEGIPSIPNAVILVSGNKIIAVGPAARVKIPSNAEKIDLKGRWIIPGLIDSHIHFFQSGGLYTRPDIIDLRAYVPYAEKELVSIKENLPDTFARYLRCGITTVLDMGGPMWNFQVRELAGKTVLAPRVFVAGPLISTYQPAALTTADPPIVKVDDIPTALRMVHDQIEKGTDFIKIWYIVRSDEPAEKNFPLVKAVCEESHRLGKRVIVHATQLETARAAVRAGADILAHLVSDKPVDPDFVRLVRQKKVICSTTIVVNEGYLEALSKNVTLSSPEQELANPFIVSSLFDLRHLPAAVDPLLTPEQVQARRERIKLTQQNLLALQKAGVVIAANTDAGNIGALPGPALFREMALMVEAGLTPLQVLTDATLNNARLLGREKELGAITVGRLADFVALGADPQKEIGNAADIRLVVKDGRMFRPEEIVRETAADTVQRQVNAYNSRDIESFLAKYADDAKIYAHPDKLLFSGREEMRQRYQRLFADNPELHLQIMSRMVHGGRIIDQERITGLAGGGVKTAVVVYEVAEGKIRRAWIMGE